MLLLPGQRNPSFVSFLWTKSGYICYAVVVDVVSIFKSAIQIQNKQDRSPIIFYREENIRTVSNARKMYIAR